MSLEVFTAADCAASIPIASNSHDCVSHAKPRQTLCDLDGLIDQIQSSFAQNEPLLRKARLVLEAKLRVEAGEAGTGVRWSDWYKDHLGFSPSRVSRCLKLALDENPATTLDKRRRDQNERQRRLRESVFVVSHAERKALVQRILELDISRVRALSAFASTL